MKISDRKSAVRPLAGLVIMCLLAGCAGTPGPSPKTAPVAALTTAVPETETRQADPMLLRSPDEAFTLGPGDRLDIEVLGDVSTRSRVVFYGSAGCHAERARMSTAPEAQPRASGYRSR